jgi:riboflavin synthase
MFTGIVEGIGILEGIEEEGSNRRFTVRSPLAHELHVDQSISVNGVCLTVEGLKEEAFTLSVIEESLLKSDLGSLSVGDRVNLERSMPADGRFDGHVVQGHVDSVATCRSVEERDGSWNLRFELDRPHEGLIVPKGSIALDGVSLTVVDPDERSFGVAIIPYTYHNTRFGELQEGDRVNVEFDILGKYVRAQVMG